MTSGHEFTSHVITSTHQVPGGLLLHGGDTHSHHLARREHLGQVEGITTVRLDAVPTGTQQFRGGRHHTLNALPLQGPCQVETGRPGLIGHPHPPGVTHTRNEVEDLPVPTPQRSLPDHTREGINRCCSNTASVNIQPNTRSI